MRITSKLCAAITGVPRAPSYTVGFRDKSIHKFSIGLGTRVGFALLVKSDRTTKLSGLSSLPKPALNDVLG